VPIDEARRDARKKIEDIYCETCKMGGKDPQIYASVLENNLQQLCKDEECYDRAIQRFVSSIQVNYPADYIRNLDLTKKT